MLHTLSACVARRHAVGIYFFEVSDCIAIRSERFYGVQLESFHIDTFCRIMSDGGDDSCIIK